MEDQQRQGREELTGDRADRPSYDGGMRGLLLVGLLACHASPPRALPATVVAPVPSFADDTAFARAALPRTLVAESGLTVVAGEGRWIVQRRETTREAALVLHELDHDGAALHERARQPLPCRLARLVAAAAYAATSCRDSLQTWSLDEGRLRATGTVTSRAPIAAITITSDGAFVVAALEGGGIEVWRTSPTGPIEVGRAGGPELHRISAARHGGELTVLGTGGDGGHLMSVPTSSSGGELAVRDHVPGITWGVLAPDGRHALVTIATKSVPLVVRVDAAAGDLAFVGELPAAISGYAFSGDDRLVVGGERSGIYRISASALVPLADLRELRGSLAFGRGGLLASDEGIVFHGPLGWSAATVEIGGEAIRWDPGPVADRSWARVSADRVSTVSGRGAIRIANTGTTPSRNVIATLELRRAGGELIRSGSIFFGTIAAGDTVTRTLPADPPGELYARLEVRTRDDDPPPPPVVWHQLPSQTRDAEAFDRKARQIFEASRDVMRELLGDPGFAPELERLSSDQVGFTTHDTTIRYQNPFSLGPDGLAINRRITRASTQAELVAELELMLAIYIPHEMIHAARNHLGHAVAGKWQEELIADSMETVLWPRVLGALPSSPYTLATLRRAIDRYVDAARPWLPDGLEAAVDGYVASDGAQPPSTDSPWRVFQANPATYVFIGARAAQATLRRAATIEELRDRYLRR